MRTILTLCGLGLIALPTYAAEIRLTSSGAPKLGDTILITAILDTEGESINALEGTLSYPEAALSLEEIRSGGSLINFWAEAPKDESGRIRFAGITPGGYLGNGGELFSLLFKVTAENDLQFSLTDARTLKNDGEASALPFTLARTVTLSDAPAQLELARLHDTTAPHPFTAYRAHDATLFDGQTFVSFATQDKESGVARYEIAEYRGFRWFAGIFSDLAWKEVTTPALLSDQRGESYVFIRAIDGAGNETQSVLSPEHIPFLYDPFLALGLLLLCIIIGTRYAIHYTRS